MIETSLSLQASNQQQVHVLAVQPPSFRLVRRINSESASPRRLVRCWWGRRNCPVRKFRKTVPGRVHRIDRPRLVCSYNTSLLLPPYTSRRRLASLYFANLTKQTSSSIQPSACPTSTTYFILSGVRPVIITTPSSRNDPHLFRHRNGESFPVSEPSLAPFNAL